MAPLIRPVRFARFSLAMSLSVAGCNASAGSASRWVAEIDTVGDTIVVRTISGSIRDSIATLVPVFQIGALEGRDEYLFGNVQGLAVDSAGAVYLSDAQVPAVRKYGPDGRYIMTLGREGSGPGEYRKGADALAILRDGRIVLRDQGNSRFQLWTPDGTPTGQWELRTGFSTGRLHVNSRSSVVQAFWSTRLATFTESPWVSADLTSAAPTNGNQVWSDTHPTVLPLIRWKYRTGHMKRRR